MQLFWTSYPGCVLGLTALLVGTMASYVSLAGAECCGVTRQLRAIGTGGCSGVSMQEHQSAWQGASSIGQGWCIAYFMLLSPTSQPGLSHSPLSTI
ncbi:hypothetical protein B0H66DRAFT_219308 [Apodospora peruviana]|uniref:Uncharacterized protein n=1 Tax=Apodospora peruviana TaxID=516989 RepID=A0AAE0M8C7_9PEZI|nr:hypothetical protein B0H66DRAFT_219308 [Apodospora peruviana]